MPKDLVSASKPSLLAPYTLDNAQVSKASKALLKHIQSKAQKQELSSGKKNLLTADSTEDTSTVDAQPVWLIFATKTHIVDQARLKPGKIILPHPLYSIPSTPSKSSKTSSSVVAKFDPSLQTSICLITADPQRSFKEAVDHPSFPASLKSQITKVIGLEKLTKRYQTFESRRQLQSEHDIFLADDRIITRLPKVLGKAFYKGSKRPLPVNLSPPQARKKNRDPAVTSVGKTPAATTDVNGNPSKAAPPTQLAAEIQRALSATQVYLSPSVTTAIRVGSSSFTPEQIAANIDTVVREMVERFVPKKWANVKAIHVKGANTLALPIWLADELWVDEGHVLAEEEVQEREKRRIEGGGERRHGLGVKRKALREAAAGGAKDVNADGDADERRKSKRIKDSADE
ncbi:hypothetical protein MMC25_002912 [Agyrium rufum]|nr:hypothetical protein [Agyrium rufum]